MSKYQKSLDRIKTIDLDLVLDELDYEKATEISVYGIHDYPNLEMNGDINVLQQAVTIADGVKNCISQLEKAQKVYWDKKHKSTDEDTKNFYRGMEHSVLACINDLKRIVGDKNE